MDRRKIIRYTLGFLALQAFAATALLFAAQPCIGLSCQTVPARDTRTHLSGRPAERVSIGDVVGHPDAYDGRMIQITGTILAVEQGASRQGNAYVVLVVADLDAPTDDSRKTLRIFAFTWPRIEAGDTVSVTGIYRMDYWFGGWPLENFLNAERIIRESVI